MLKIYTNYWPLFFTFGAFLSYFSEALGIEKLEIHYRLFLIFAFAAMSWGGYLMAIFPWQWTLGICLLLLIGWLYFKYQRKS